MKALKVFVKPFEVPQRKVKIKIYLNFFVFVQDWDERVKMHADNNVKRQKGNYMLYLELHPRYI